MPASGPTAYQVPTICTGVGRPSFYLGNHLPNTVQSQNICSSILPWPCVQARLPNHQVPNASHNIQQSTPAAMNPMMTFVSTGHTGHIASAPHVAAPNSSRIQLSNPRRPQVSVFILPCLAVISCILHHLCTYVPCSPFLL